MQPLQFLGAVLAIVGIIPSVFGTMYVLGGTWVMTDLHETIRIISMGIIGTLFVWIGLRLWYAPLHSPAPSPDDTTESNRHTPC